MKPQLYAFSNSTYDNIVNYFNTEYKEYRYQNYISAGRKNDWFIELNSLIAKSPIHASALSTKIDMIAGAGIQKTDDLLFNQFIFNKYDNKTVEQIAKDITEDLEIAGGFAIKIYFNAQRQIAKLEHVPIHKLRFPDDDKTFAIYSDNWLKNNSERISYPVWQNSTDKRYNHYIHYVDGSLNNLSVYPRPDYQAIIPYCLTESLISQYHYSNAENGYNVGAHLNIPSNSMTPDEMDALIKNFDNQYKGAGKAGKLLVTFSDATGNAASFTPISGNDGDRKFLEILNKVEDKILQGHRITASILGIEAAGKSLISNGDELINQIEAFKSTYVRPKQKLIEDTFNNLLKFNNIKPLFKLNEFQLLLPKKVDANVIMGIAGNTTINDETKRILLRIEGMSDDDIIKMIPTNDNKTDNNGLLN